MSGATTKLQKANQGKSLRTTVPLLIRDHFDLTEGDVLNWQIDKIDGKWVAIVTVEEK